MQSLLFETCFWVHCKVDTQRYLMTPTQSPPDAWLATWHRLNVGWFTLSAAGGTSTPSSQPQTQKQLPDTTKFTIFLSFFPLFDRYTGASTNAMMQNLPFLEVVFGFCCCCACCSMDSATNEKGEANNFWEWLSTDTHMHTHIHTRTYTHVHVHVHVHVWGKVCACTTTSPCTRATA